MSEPVAQLSDEQIRNRAAEFAKQITSLQGKGKATDRNQKRREWVFFLKSLSSNARRTIARNAYWAEYDRLQSSE